MSTPDARAWIYDEGRHIVAEYVEDCSMRPGACDETFGGGGEHKRERGFTVGAGPTPTKPLPHGPNMLLTSKAGGKWINYRIDNELVDIDTKQFHVQQRFHNGRHGYYIDKDDPWDAPWFRVYGHEQSPTRR
jgi:hypothetical protein